MQRPIEVAGVLVALLIAVGGVLWTVNATYATFRDLWLAVTEARLESLTEDLDDDAWRVYELNKARDAGQTIDAGRLQYLEGQVDAGIRKVERLENLQQTLETSGD